MTIDIKEDNNSVIATLSGRLDTLSATETAPSFQHLASMAARPIIIDCTELQYISSSGLRLFLSVRKAALAVGSSVTVRNINNEIRNIFAMTGFIKLFTVE